MPQNLSPSSQCLVVFRAEDFTVTSGANLGDPVSFAADLMLDDIYQLNKNCVPQQLSLSQQIGRQFRISTQSAIGQPEAQIYLDSALSFMCPNGQVLEALLLVEVNEKGYVAAVYLLPLTPFEAKTNYHLIRIDPASAIQKFAHAASVSFTRGTQITLPSGAQRAIEKLRVGDTVLTRDQGPQEICWIGQTTLRAAGAFAPIRIRKGALNNTDDLLLSPNHRLFIYQRKDPLRLGRAELMVRAVDLLNGTTVQAQSGGFVDYFQLLFNGHQIIYAEGIAAESMWVNAQTMPELPGDLPIFLAAGAKSQEGAPYQNFETSLETDHSQDAAALLRRASAG